MHEQTNSYNVEPQAVKHAIYDMREGPVDVLLYSNLVQIVDPVRDLQQPGWNAKYLVIDPNSFDPKENTGFKGLRDGDSMVLGRNNTYGRFNFSNNVSAEHVRISLEDDELVIEDLNSKNGTFVIQKSVENPHYDQSVEHISDTQETRKIDIYEAKGKTVPSEKHPDYNDDSVLINENAKLIAVFDGVGGLPGSSQASAIASEAVNNQLSKLDNISDARFMEAMMSNALQKSHQSILAQNNGEKIATTATVLKQFKNEQGEDCVAIANVGDSRAYLYRDNKLMQLTLDHSSNYDNLSIDEAKQLQVKFSEVNDISQLTTEEQQAFKKRGSIREALGPSDEYLPKIDTLTIKSMPGDKFILVTDGIHDNLTSSEIESTIANSKNSDEIIDNLINNAKKRSQDDKHLRAKKDDMTAALMNL